MKKLSKVLVISLIALVMAIAIAACSSAPSYIKNIPADSADLVTKLEADGWEADETTILGIGMVFGMKSSFKEEDLETIKNTDKITVEFVIVTYFLTEEKAKEAKKEMDDEMKEQMDEAKKDMPKGASVSYSTFQSGKAIALYIKASATFADFDDIEDLFGF